jgi:pimeloyl-ACP methyl ester carboxylesterase
VSRLPGTSVQAADGVEVATHDLGGHGADLLMAHAAGLHGLVFAPLARCLASDFRCVSYDARGHGDSGLPAGGAVDWYGLAADVLAVVDGLALDRPYGFGHSSGGTALLMAEQTSPGTFAALYCFEPVIVVADPPLGRDDDSPLAAQARRRRQTFASCEEAYEHYAGKPPFDVVDPEALRAYVEHGFEPGDGGTVRLKCRPETEALVYETATAHDAYVRMPEVTCPVIVACGSCTEACTPTRARSHTERLVAGQSEVVDGVGHLGPLERPERVAASVRRLLSWAPHRAR